MTTFDNTFDKDLDQIRARQLELLGEINAIRDQYDAPNAADIDRIRAAAIVVLDEIDEIRDRQTSNSENRQED